MKKRVVSLILMLALVLSLIGGCSPAVSNDPDPVNSPDQAENQQQQADVSAEPEGNKPYGTLRMYTTTEITTLNPHENMDSDAESLIKGTLLKPYEEVPTEDGSTSHYVPELAAELPTPLNDEQTEWTFPIRQDLYWENGDHITAEDFVYSMKMVLDPLLLTSRGASVASDYITVVNAEAYMSQTSTGETVDWSEVGIEALDEYTIKITCETYAEQIDVIRQYGRKWCGLVNEELYESCMSDDRTSCTYGTSLDTYMSCGMFRLTDFQPGVSYTMERSDEYFDQELIKIEAYNLRVVKDSNTALELFLNGELDKVNLSAAAKEQYEDDPRILQSPASTVSVISLNRINTNQNGILGNLNFRKAIFYAVDRETIAKMVKGVPANYILGQKVLGNVETGEKYRDLAESQVYLADNYAYDTELAKQYYETALAECGISEVTLELIYNESSDNLRTAAEYLEQALPQILGDSFKIELNPMEKNLVKQQRKAWKKGDTNSFELSFSSWDTSSLCPWNAMKVYCSWYSSGTDPILSDEFDELWDLANNSREAKENLEYRLSLTQQMEKMALDDVFVVPMYEVPTYSLLNERITLPFDHYVPGYGWGMLYCTIAEGM